MEFGRAASRLASRRKVQIPLQTNALRGPVDLDQGRERGADPVMLGCGEAVQEIAKRAARRPLQQGFGIAMKVDQGPQFAPIIDEARLGDERFKLPTINTEVGSCALGLDSGPGES